MKPHPTRSRLPRTHAEIPPTLIAWGIALLGVGLAISAHGQSSGSPILWTVVAGSRGAPGFANGIGPIARLNNPQGLAAGPQGRMYVADYDNHVIRRLTMVGSQAVLETVAGMPGVMGYADGTTAEIGIGNDTSPVRFHHPTAVALDAAGDLLVADTGNHVIRKITFDPDGTKVSTLAGTPGWSGLVDGVGMAARFNAPGGVTVRSDGLIFVSDYGNNVLRALNSMGPVAIVNTMPPPTSFPFFAPLGLGADRDNNVYVAHQLALPYGQPAVSRLRPTGEYDVVLPDGYAAAVSVDAQRQVFVLIGNAANAVQLEHWEPWYKRDWATGASILEDPPKWGNRGRYPGLDNPRGIAVDSDGALFVSDASEHVILRGVRPPTMVRYPENYVGRGILFTDPNPDALGPAVVGATVTFTALATGGGPYQHQWRKGAVPIPGATESSLTLNNVQLADAGFYYRVTRNPAGSVEGKGELQVTPFYGEPPESVTYVERPRQTVNEGDSVRFSVAVVGGTPPLQYQWYFRNNPLPGANETTLVLPSVTPDQQGPYFFEVRNSSNVRPRTSSEILTVIPAVPIPPRITLHPVATVQAAGATAAFEVTASGSEPLTYQWQHDGQDLPGANARTLTLSNLRRTQAGPYSVVVTNRGGSATSNAAWLEVYGGDVPDDYVFTTIAGAAGQVGTTDGPGAAARFQLPQGLKLDSQGNLYIADTVNHTIRKLTPDGVVSTIAGVAGQHWDPDAPNAAQLLYEPTDVALDDAGNVFVADSRSHSIRKITANGVMSTFAGLPGVAGWEEGRGTAARFKQPWGLAFQSVGKILLVADRGNASIREIQTDGTVSTKAGDPARAEVVDGLLGMPRFADPVAVTVADGQFSYVAESDGRVVRSLVTLPLFFAVGTIAGRAGDPGVSDGLADGRLVSPGGVAADHAGNVFVTDATANTIRKITKDSILVTIAGMPSQSGSNDGPASQTRFYGLTGIAVGSDGVLFIADTFNSTIRRGDPVRTLRSPVILRQPLSATVIVGQPASLEVSSIGAAPLTYQWFFKGAPLPGTHGPVLDFPATTRNQAGRYVVMVSNAQGNVLSAESLLDVVLPAPTPPRITKPPSQVVLADGGTAVFGVTAEGTEPLSYQWQWQGQVLPGATTRTLTLANTHRTQAGFYSVVITNAAGAVTSDAASLIVYGGTVPDDYLFTTLAGSPNQIGSANGTGATARFNHPRGIELDPAGNLFVADTGNHAIRKVTSDGQVTLFAGVPGQAWSAGAPNAANLLSEPTDIAIDAAGNLYVADSGTHTIRKVTPAGVVSVFAGQPGESGWLDGVGTDARFNRPTGVAMDPSGILYIADRGNFVVRTISRAGAVGTPTGIAGVSAVKDDVGGEATFGDPSAIGVEMFSKFVAEFDRHVVRKISVLPPLGVFTDTLAGNPEDAGTADGPAPLARLSAPGGVIMDSTGDVLLTDYSTHTLRRVTVGGVLVTIAGATDQRGTADGPASVARFSGPTGIAMDAAGRIFIADTDASTLRRGDPVSKAIQPIVVHQPTGQWVLAGESAAFEVAVTGTQPLSYQWFKEVKTGTSTRLDLLPGQTNPSLSVSNTRRGNAGTYVVRVSNPMGETYCRAAPLTVVSSLPDLAVQTATLVGTAPNVSLRFEMVGVDPGEPLVIESSADLRTWETWLTLPSAAASTEITQPLGESAQPKFFRVRQ